MTRTTAELRQYLAGEWLFDNDFKDTSGNGNDGTPTDVEWKPTLRGMKPSFNGTSFVSCALGDVESDEFTITLWFKMRISDDNSPIWSYYENDDNRLYVYYKKSTSQVIVFGKFGGVTFVSLTADNVSMGAWHQMTVSIKRNNSSKILIDGIISDDYTSPDITLSYDGILYIAAYNGTTIDFFGNQDDFKFYKTALTEDESLLLYNETKGEYGVMPAEHSFTYNPDDVIVPSDAVGAWGTAKESTTKLVDLSGNNNIVTIEGAMPAGGFIHGRRFGGNDVISCGNSTDLNILDGTIVSIFKSNDTTEAWKMLHHKYTDGVPNSGYFARLTNTGIVNLVYAGDADVSISSGIGYNDDKIHVLIWSVQNDAVTLELDGLLIGSVTGVNLVGSIATFNIGGVAARFIGEIYYTIIKNIQIDKTVFYNTLARLPFWAVNYTDYPDNVTEYTDNLPYSSSIISSGTFKVDDDKLQCVAAGTMTYSASYEFDGSEFIKVTIDGVEYAGTGTITQGNTTVSVAQGSNKITIVMGTGGTIGEIGIQFRKVV